MGKSYEYVQVLDDIDSKEFVCRSLRPAVGRTWWKLVSVFVGICAICVRDLCETIMRG